jgi:hypothetical protein
MGNGVGACTSPRTSGRIHASTKSGAVSIPTIVLPSLHLEPTMEATILVVDIETEKSRASA